MDLSWKDIEKLVASLSKRINADFEPDVVIALGEGGWIPGRLLKNHIKCRYFSMGCKNYDEKKNMLDTPIIIQGVEKEEITGKNVLIVDEVADSGKTLRMVCSYLSEFEPGIMRTAVLHKKSTSTFIPDYIASDTGEEWINYPWEAKV